MSLWETLSSKPVSAAAHEAKSQRAFDITSLLVAGSFCILLVVVLVRVTQLQVAPSASLQEQMKPRVSSRPVLPVRGDIKDRRDRVLAATRFGWRVIVDPTNFPQEPGTQIVSLAQTLSLSENDVGERILRAMVENDRRAEAAGGAAIRVDDASPAARLARILNQRVERVAEAARLPLTLPTEDPAVIGEPVGEVHPDSPLVDPDSAAPDTSFADVSPRNPIRYLPVGGVIDDALATRVRALKIKGVSLERRQVRDYPGGNTVASIVGKVGVEHQGLMGTELMLEKALGGTPGRVAYTRDARGRPLWTAPGQVVLPQSGTDVRLTIDLEIQRIATEELQRGIEDADAVGGRCVIIDPRTGEILAMVDIVRDLPTLKPYPWPDKPVKQRGRSTPTVPHASSIKYDRYITLVEDKGRKVHPALGRNRCVEDVYEPGSTFKPFVWATITELGLARPEEVFDTEGGRWRTFYGRPIQDVTRRATMTWRDVLVNSSNIGMIKGAERLSFLQLREVPLRFGFGSRTEVGLPGEATGIVTNAKNWSKYTQTSVAYGHEIAVTPLQMVRAFSAFAREGDLAGTMPQLRLTGATDPEASDLTRGVIVRVLKPETAILTRYAMRGVADNMEHRWAKAPEGGWRYTLFGKSGTAEIPLGPPPEGKARPRGGGYFEDQYNSSFVAGAPIEDPRVAIIVVIDDPGPSRVFSSPKSHYGAATAGPVVRRTVERTLAYLGVTPSPEAASTPESAKPRRQ